MHVSSPRRLVLGCSALALSLLGACNEGEDTSASGFSGGSVTASQPTQATSATQPQTSAETTAGTTGDLGTTGDPPTTGQPATVTEASSTTTDDPSAGTTTDDPATSDPSTTTGVDPSTTTGVDPSTTTGVDPSTTTTTGMTSMTTMEDTTGEPMMPPAKDPQPANGLYEPCVDNTPCEPALTDGCFTITDSMTMQIIDGYCTILCTSVADCGPAPKAPAVQECFAISANQKVCGLKCKGVADCPTGMACTGLALPNNQTGMYCT